MPDWSYQTVFRPLLNALPPRTGRDVALTAMGTLACLPWGGRVIDLMGHMRPPRELGATLCGVPLASPVGLGPGIDTQLTGLPALLRFGFGFVELGPVTVAPVPEGLVERDDVRQRVVLGRSIANPGVEEAVRRLKNIPQLRPPIIARLAWLPGMTEANISEQLAQLVVRLRDQVQFFSLAVPQSLDQPAMVDAWHRHLKTVIDGAPTHPIFIAIPANADPTKVQPLVETATQLGAKGVIIARAEEGEWAELGATIRELAKRQIQAVRGVDSQLPIIATAGIHEPADALELLDAGADFVQVDSGLVFSGPGLPKRINEVILHRRFVAQATSAADDGPPARRAWFWTFLLGLAMLLGGVMALVIASTRVVMPYDEAMSGLTRDEIAAVNPRLLPFMTHDRVTLAGTMLAVGILYATLSWGAVRRGQHWAWLVVVSSALAGFASFFSFLGFGYFDPFHAFVSVVLLQFTLLALVTPLPSWQPLGIPDLRNDLAWRLSQWGQLAFVVHGAAILTAGVVISIVGMSHVFVQSDLDYLEICAEDLTAIPQLVPLVAHDRGTFGGMLLVCGLVTLLTALWGFRRGVGWLWWGLMSAGVVGYGLTIAVHHIVGYVDSLHLAPAYGGLAVLAIGGGLSWPYLCGRADR